MTLDKECQVCAKPILEEEMCFKKEFDGQTYFTCCPICFSLLQKHPEEYIGDYFPRIHLQRK